MIIRHNIAAMNASRFSGSNTDNLSKTLEKLSSGYRINRSADDAAGLAISEKMRMLLAGTDQAMNNVQDGINLIQTAEGAMTEIHDMLNRAYELSMAACNGTYNSDDRQAMEDEITQLKTEIDRITQSTKFNGIPLLQGPDQNPDPPVSIDPSAGLPAWVTGGPALADGHITDEFTTGETYYYEDATGTKQTGTATIKHSAAKLDFTALASNSLSDLFDKGFYTTCLTCNRHYTIQFTDSTTNSIETSGSHYIYKVGIQGVTTAEELVDRVVAATSTGALADHFTKLEKDPNNPGVLVIYDQRAKEKPPLVDSTGNPLTSVSWDSSWKYPYFGYTASASSNYGKFGLGVATAPAGTVSPGSLILQIGPHSGDQMTVQLPDTSSTALRLFGISVTTENTARNSLNVLTTTIDYVSSERSRMGAYQNRLEHTHNNLGVSTENLQQSESTIRDADIAEEMMVYTKQNILIQAAQAMLSQANQVPQGVLSLLNG